MTVGDTKPRLGITVPGLTSGRDNWTRSISNIQFGNSIPGGFGYFRFQLPWPNTNPPQGVDFAVPILVIDESGRTVFEGRIEDIELMVGDNAGYNIECAGFQRLLDEPYRGAPVNRNIDWQQRPLHLSTNIRPDIVNTMVGATDTTDGAKAGVTFSISQPITLNQQNALIFYPGSAFDAAVEYRRLKFDYIHTGAMAVQMDLQVGSIDSAGTATLQSSGNTAAGTFSLDVALPALTRGVLIQFICTAAGTPSGGLSARLYNMRLLGSRAGGLTQEPVYGHEILKDVISMNSLIDAGAGNIDTDTSYGFDQAAWLDSTTGRQVLDYVTGFYDRYWAVWEDKQLYWRSLDTTQPTWNVKRAQCMAGTRISASILESSSAVKARYQTLKGLTREVTTNDGRVDNVFRAQGTSHIEIVDLGIVANAAAASRIGATFFPDHSYEFLRGTVILPALEPVASSQWGKRPAYTMRSGEVVRLQDIVSSRDLFGSTFDRKSTFVIRSVDVDWEAQTVTLNVDNVRDTLSQLLARISTGLGVRFG